MLTSVEPLFWRHLLQISKLVFISLELVIASRYSEFLLWYWWHFEDCSRVHLQISWSISIEPSYIRHLFRSLNQLGLTLTYSLIFRFESNIVNYKSRNGSSIDFSLKGLKFNVYKILAFSWDTCRLTTDCRASLVTIQLRFSVISENQSFSLTEFHKLLNSSTRMHSEGIWWH